jgi:hypothetical protein
VLPLEAASRLCREPVIAVDVGPGFDMASPGPAAPAPPLVRAHDEAVATLMAAHTAAQLALWRADPGRPPLLYVGPATVPPGQAARDVLTRAGERT